VLYSTLVVVAPAVMSNPSGFRGARDADRVFSNRYVNDHANEPSSTTEEGQEWNKTWGAPLAMPEPFSLSPAARA
jgi:hypothetical protein